MQAGDKSNGYERCAAWFIAHRGTDPAETGVREVTAWGRTLASGATVLDLGCGTGIPISRALMACGLKVCGIDASPSMAAAFRERFPDPQVQCAAVEDSDFFGRTFDGVVAWGLMFLLQAETQPSLIAKVATHLAPGGKFLFTAPRQNGHWNDVLTGEVSVSLGREAYCEALEAAGLALVGNTTDDGENYYYFAQRR